MELTQMLAKYRVIPMASAEKFGNLFPVVGALSSGGIPLVCVKVGQESDIDMLGAVIRTFEDLQLGAWVTDIHTAQKCIDAGVKFICTPGVSRPLAKVCAEGGIRYLPGCATASDVMLATELSLNTVMLCPAEALGGRGALDLFITMFPNTRFIACLVSEETDIKPYFENPRVLALATPTITCGSLDEIAKKSQDFVAKYARGNL